MKQTDTNSARTVKIRGIYYYCFAVFAGLTFSGHVSAQISSYNVMNVGALPLDLEIIDTLCNVTVFEGRIIGNAKISATAC